MLIQVLIQLEVIDWSGGEVALQTMSMYVYIEIVKNWVIITL